MSRFHVSKPGMADRVRFGFGKDPAALRHAAFRALTAVQDETPEVQIMSLCAAFSNLAVGVGLDPHELLTTFGRAARDHEGPFTNQLQAIRDYATGHLK